MVTEQITVTAGAPLLETDSNALGHVVTTRNIRTLPLNGRRFFDLALLTAGAAPEGSTLSSAVWGRVTGVALAGARDLSVSFLIDGAETRDERYGGTFQFSSLESIQEFKVQQNFVDAAARIDPISHALIAYWPEPNLLGNAANYITTVGERKIQFADALPKLIDITLKEHISAFWKRQGL